MSDMWTVAKLRRDLAEQLAGDVAFESRAVAGERLRRRLAALEVVDAGAEATLAEYDEWIAAWDGDVPGDLDGQMQSALDDLQELGAREAAQRDVEEGQQLALRLDSVLCVVAAASRCGRMTAEQVQDLADRASARIREVRTPLFDLWGFADDQTLSLASDSDHPGLFGWWDDLAEFSPMRLGLVLALEQIERQRRIDELSDRVVANYVAAQQPGPLVGFVNRVKELLAAVKGVLTVDTPVTAGAFQSPATTALRTESVLEIGGEEDGCEPGKSLMTVKRTVDQLLIQVKDGYIVEPVAAELGDGRKLAAKNVRHDLVVVQLPAGVGEQDLEIRLLVQNEPVTLPRMRLVPAKEGE